MFNTPAFSMILFSGLRQLGEILLLIGLSGEVALLILKITKGSWEKGLGITFAVLVLLGCGLEWWADSPRTLSAASQQRLTQTLTPYHGTPFDFSVELDPEAVSLMEMIGSALEAAGWKRQAVAHGHGYVPPGKPTAGLAVLRGVEVHVTQARMAEWGADGRPGAALLQALRNEGLTAVFKVIPDHHEGGGAIHIMVGAKP
ncbi:hypothetical protein BN1110_01762 [bacterium YEK0313]|nr:hypothetical protein BN1110_01762 [bacterium YEK0313]